MIFGREASAALRIGTDRVIAVIEADGGKSASFSCDGELTPNGAPATEGAIRKAADWVTANSTGHYTAAAVYLTDTQVTHIVTEVETLPSGKKQADRFVEWCIAEMLSRDPGELTVGWQATPSDRNDQEAVKIYALVADRSLSDAITSAFTTPKIRIRGIQSLYNGVANTLETAAPASRVDVLLDTEFWLTARYLGAQPESLRSHPVAAESGQQALSRDLARAINEEGFESIRFFRADSGKIDTAAMEENLRGPAGELQTRTIDIVPGGDGSKDPAIDLMPRIMEMACISR